MWVVGSTILAMIMGSIALMIRMRAARKPATTKKIILPPIFMSTGFLMFLYPPTRVEWSEALEAFTVGAIFSLLLIRTSSFEQKSDAIYLKRSKAFAFILIGLLLFRIVLKIFLGQQISIEETSGLFFILAFGMIAPWRIAMYFKFKRLQMIPES
ncbi:CcdC family protein [Pseudalkalibacillus berkeleyi]|uniref:Cytochrome c biogenesis protein CcdC n=1 Tax=Pseudalkalibacillus berkeleyi TaxID=1069813 RepID=A0ABS9GZV2_9BACL|nr:cytochrome c biogenesis protein CcdC [Pseudalkalibacillus berkeleyi]MCF6137220.1 cytochrome c biogenesis protein CcdC [Pseudalkalibacillus berkeleyi]